MRESNSSYPLLLSWKKDEWVSEGFGSALNLVLPEICCSRVGNRDPHHREAVSDETREENHDK